MVFTLSIRRTINWSNKETRTVSHGLTALKAHFSPSKGAHTIFIENHNALSLTELFLDRLENNLPLDTPTCKYLRILPNFISIFRSLKLQRCTPTYYKLPNEHEMNW